MKVVLYNTQIQFLAKRTQVLAKKSRVERRLPISSLKRFSVISWYFKQHTTLLHTSIQFSPIWTQSYSNSFIVLESSLWNSLKYSEVRPFPVADVNTGAPTTFFCEINVLFVLSQYYLIRFGCEWPLPCIYMCMEYIQNDIRGKLNESRLTKSIIHEDAYLRAMLQLILLCMSFCRDLKWKGTW